MKSPLPPRKEMRSDLALDSEGVPRHFQGQPVCFKTATGRLIPCWVDVLAMNIFKALLVVGFAGLLAGCASHPASVAVTPLPPSARDTTISVKVNFSCVTHTLMCRDVSLSLRVPKDSELEMRLVSIADDATTTIQLDSGESLSAKPGECFSCSQFGRSGLELISASHQTGTAVFRRTWCESR
jgi:hypothetical protein